MSKSQAAAAFIGSFALRAPGKDDKPLGQKRKAAFDAAPKKQPGKLQFSTSNLSKKPGDDAEDGKQDAALQQNKDGKLQRWLQAGGGDRPGMEEARDYLLRGTPYKGSHARNTKDAVKEAGAERGFLE